MFAAISLLLLTLPCNLAGAAEASDPQVDEQLLLAKAALPNFHFVSAGAERFTEVPDPLRFGVYRGAVPVADSSLTEGFKVLYDLLGVKTAIALDGSRTLIEAETKAAKQAGVALVAMKLGPGTFRPTQARMREILTFLDDPGHYPVFIHCSDGQQKTGLVIAMYRYFIEGIPAQTAFAEMEESGDAFWNAGLRCFFQLATGMRTPALCSWLPALNGI